MVRYGFVNKHLNSDEIKQHKTHFMCQKYTIDPDIHNVKTLKISYVKNM